jgi:hypothetical protein
MSILRLAITNTLVVIHGDGERGYVPSDPDAAEKSAAAYHR